MIGYGADLINPIQFLRNTAQISDQNGVVSDDAIMIPEK